LYRHLEAHLRHPLPPNNYCCPLLTGWRADSRRCLLTHVYARRSWNGMEVPGPKPLRAGPLWNAERLRSWLESACADATIVVLSNRAPFHEERTRDGRMTVRRSSGGLVTALEPLLTHCRGVWVAHGPGSSDRAVVDRGAGIGSSPANCRCRVRHVRLSTREQRGYYDGFSNEALWPLCHRSHVRPVFRANDFRTYREVNARFAEVVSSEAGSDSPVVLVQDYHFALAPHMIRAHVPSATVVAFWHIPFPSYNDFSMCPWRRELLEGLLASSIVGFQTSSDCLNFMDSAERVLGAQLDRTQNVVTHGGRQTWVRAYPASVDWPSQWTRLAPPIDTCRRSVRRSLGLPDEMPLVVGIDRLDYTKGIQEKFLAAERLLESRPSRPPFVLVQIAEPSRAHLPEYRKTRSRVLKTAARVNRRFGSREYRPLIVLERHVDPPEVFSYLRAADVCYVGSLHDGMNLVAKEFASARDDESGVLVLSEFTGAAHELTTALRVNPYAIDECATTLANALSMPREQQRTRMRTMRAIVAHSNSYRWAADMLADAFHRRMQPTALHDIDFGRSGSSDHVRMGASCSTEGQS
jgi:trehalose 6-phosphate synthase